MTFEISEVQDSDIEGYVHVELAGFGNDPVARIFHGCDLSSPPADIAALVAKQRKSLHEKKNMHMLKVSDSDTGALVACAAWHFSPAKTQEELDKPLEFPDTASPAKVAILRTYLGTGNDVMGAKPYWTLGNMVTHPEYRRRGAGSLLMQWGVEQADRDGLETYIDATSSGKLLYDRFGFETVKEVVYEYSEGDFAVRETHTCMIRTPRPLATKIGWQDRDALVEG